MTGEAGRRTEAYPGYARATRRILRGSLGWEAAHPTGPSRALYASMRAEEVSLGEGALPAEELRFLGGSEGLRGYRDRAFAGDRILAMTLEHRWLTGPRGVPARQPRTSPPRAIPGLRCRRLSVLVDHGRVFCASRARLRLSLPRAGRWLSHR